MTFSQDEELLPKSEGKNAEFVLVNLSGKERWSSG